jgi:hypothetical protein
MDFLPQMGTGFKRNFFRGWGGGEGRNDIILVSLSALISFADHEKFVD